MRTKRRGFLRKMMHLGAGAATSASMAGIAFSKDQRVQQGPPCKGSNMPARGSIEPIIEPDLPIIDAHHHLWVLPESFFLSPSSESLRRYSHYLLEDFLADVMTGHNVRATVYMEADPMRPMYRRTGLEEMKSLGEVEFANGVAAMAASGIFGDVQVCAAIVGHTKLEQGEAAVEKILTAHLQAGGGRYRGIRQPTISSRVPQLLLNKQFRSGFGCLRKMGLSFDALIVPKELPELTDLARSFPETQIVLNHCGLPNAKEFSHWNENMKTLAGCSNVVVKLGGLGMMKLDLAERASPLTSEQLATIWKPYIQGCIEAFGAERCMFEGNFPMDMATSSYPVLWNTFKRLAMHASKDERNALFHGTAARVYKIVA